VERNVLKYLLDTAPWLNGLTMPEVLPRRIRKLLGSAETKSICSISLLEVSQREVCQKREQGQQEDDGDHYNAESDESVLTNLIGYFERRPLELSPCLL
jgi:hypothetical protein